MSSRLVVASIWFSSGRRLAAMRAAGRALRIAPAGMTPPVTGEGRAYDIERGQFDHLTRIRDEESGLSILGYSARSIPVRRAEGPEILRRTDSNGWRKRSLSC
jgi:hypothetical protein